MNYVDKIDRNNIPQHIAIIMDGNGRWAQQRGMERSMGHKAGAEAVQPGSVGGFVPLTH